MFYPFHTNHIRTLQLSPSHESLKEFYKWQLQWVTVSPIVRSRDSLMDASYRMGFWKLATGTYGLKKIRIPFPETQFKHQSEINATNRGDP
jgi:hypothetical protein